MSTVTKTERLKPHIPVQYEARKLWTSAGFNIKELECDVCDGDKYCPQSW